MNIIINTVRTFGIALAMLAVVTSPLSVSASEEYGGEYIEFYGDQNIDFYPDQYMDFYPDQYTDFYGDQYQYYDYGGYGGGSYGGYGGGSYGGGSIGGGLVGGGFIGSRGSLGYSSSASSVYAPSNTCTAPNTCNDNSVFSAPTTVTISNNGNYHRDYDYGYRPPVYNYPPVYQNPVPYVTLSQVPYTGLELGFWGTITYWSFIVLWCLVAAYLIAIKKIHTRIAARIKLALFGDDSAVTHPAYMPANAGSSATASVIRSTSTPTPTPIAMREDLTDSFILSQIQRTG